MARRQKDCRIRGARLAQWCVVVRGGAPRGTGVQSNRLLGAHAKPAPTQPGRRGVSDASLAGGRSTKSQWLVIRACHEATASSVRESKRLREQGMKVQRISQARRCATP